LAWREDCRCTPGQSRDLVLGWIRSGSVYLVSAIVRRAEQVQRGFIEKIDPLCYIDPSAQEPVMRKIFFVIAIAAAVVGAGVVVASLADPELAAAKCTARC
jgi:hypothetical protein